MNRGLRCRETVLRLAVAGALTLAAGRFLAAQDLPPIAGPSAPGAAPPSQEKLGTAPEDYSHEFLRQESVLLKPGDWQLDTGLNYTVYDHYFTGIEVNGVTIAPVNERLRRRLLLMPLEFRLGICDNVQAFVNMPVGWANSEVSSVSTNSETDYNTGGIGDTNAGFSWLIHKSDGCSCDPDVVATFGFTAPTGNGNFLEDLFLTPETTLGQGFWYGYFNVLFIHTYDPVIVFYGFGARFGFSRVLDELNVQPGDQYSYRGGVGFAVNERITLSTQLYGSYITEPLINGQRIKGDDLEPIYLRFAVTISQCCNRICEPFAEVGLTSDSAGARFGVTWTF